MAQQMTPIKFEEIENVAGGALAVKINKELRKAYLDCADAPNNNAWRSVTFSIKMKPTVDSQLNGQTDFSGCVVRFSVAGRQPEQAIEIQAIDSPQGLLFNVDAADNPRQLTIDHDQARYEEKPDEE